MENDCVIIKRKEYEELKALAESKKPDEIWITFAIRPSREFESFPMVVVDQQKMSTKIEGKLIWQIRSIIENLSIKFDKTLSERENFWIDHRLPKMINQEREKIKTHIRNEITTDLEDLIQTVPFWALRSELTKMGKEILLNNKYFE